MKAPSRSVKTGQEMIDGRPPFHSSLARPGPTLGPLPSRREVPPKLRQSRSQSPGIGTPPLFANGGRTTPTLDGSTESTPTRNANRSVPGGKRNVAESSRPGTSARVSTCSTLSLDGLESDNRKTPVGFESSATSRSTPGWPARTTSAPNRVATAKLATRAARQSRHPRLGAEGVTIDRPPNRTGTYNGFCIISPWLVRAHLTLACERPPFLIRDLRSFADRR